MRIMQGSAELEREIKQLIVETLSWPGLSPEHIDTEQPLFADGLGLDSLDALRIAGALSRRYGVAIEGGEPTEALHFSCVKSLAGFVAAALEAAHAGCES